MKVFTRTLVAVAALISAASVSAAEIDGTWVGTLGQSEVKFVLKADGEKLTGTLDNAAQPGAVEIKEGKIKGSDVSFHVVRALDNAETKVQWTGKLAGDELKLQRGAVGTNAAAEVVAKRAKQ
jgi:hypothetical protein